MMPASTASYGHDTSCPYNDVSSVGTPSIAFAQPIIHILIGQ